MFNKNSIATIVAISLTLGVIGPMVAFAAGPATVDLGTAGNFVILAKSGISTTGSTSITGDIGVSPIDSTAITGFGLTLDGSNTFSTSALVTGKVYAADYTDPTPATMTAAVGDMETAYTDAAGRTLPTATELGAGNIGGLTFVPGLYKWSTNVTIPTNITLAGGANDVWIFQIAQNLTVSSAMHVILSGGAQAKNVFWQVAGQTTIGTTAVVNGIILDQTAIVIQTGATLNGRALAQTAVTLDSNNVSISAGSSSTPTSTIPLADLSIVKTADVTSTLAGGAIIYTLTVMNLGPGTSTGVVARDILPSELTFVKATPSVGTYIRALGRWMIGTLSAGSSATLTISVIANLNTSGDLIKNTATVRENDKSKDNNLGNNSSMVTVLVMASNGGGGGGNGGGSGDDGDNGGGGSCHYSPEN